ncbi:radical SAM/SPASM domain-containing protein [Varibaculum massiliense]|uniref:radical SAM/SPASM domain-containing protein n=1 Tax=Varibaculum massiliense TaxID=1852372 RepID=UPI001356579C|nr:radical SAM protein [Varibaculum massiliense]
MVDTKGVKHCVLLNADTGAWAELSETEKTDWQQNRLEPVNTRRLQAMGVLADLNDRYVDLSAPWRNKPLERIIVNLNRSCNMRCAYCFLSAEATPTEMMSPQVMRTVAAAGLNRSGEHFVFDLHGGEPTLSLITLRRFLEIAEELRKNSRKVVRYSIVTNGTLISDEFIELALKYQIRVGLSLDGPPEIHDIARRFHSGRQTGEIVLDGLAKMRTAGVSVEGAICTLGKHNFGKIKEVCEFFGGLSLPFKARPLTPRGRGDSSGLSLDPGEWFTAFVQLYRQHEAGVAYVRTVESFKKNCWSGDRSNACLRIPCGAANTLIAIDPNGDCYPCDGYCGDTDVRMGNIQLESYDAMAQKPEVVELRSRTSNDIYLCNDCDFRGMCGPCGYSSKASYGDVVRPDRLCGDRMKIFRFLITEWLEKFGYTQ